MHALDQVSAAGLDALSKLDDCAKMKAAPMISMTPTKIGRYGSSAVD